MFTVSRQQEVRVIDLGVIPWREAYDIQRDFVWQVIGGQAAALILCEHPAVITMGRAAHPQHLLLTGDELRREGVDVLEADRGGDVTLHAPGQLVLYPIIDLNHYGRDLRAYLRAIESAVIVTLQSFGIDASRNSANTGLWAGQKKIMSLGIGVKRWVAYHGLGLNVNTDLSLFRYIKPCGLDVEMTSMERQTGNKIDIQLVKNRLIDCFCRHFQLESDKDL
jgi:lipoate-protein ligase B